MEAPVATAAALVRAIREARLETLKARAQVLQLKQQVVLLQRNIKEDRDALEESQAESDALREELRRAVAR